MFRRPWPATASPSKPTPSSETTTTRRPARLAIVTSRDRHLRVVARSAALLHDPEDLDLLVGREPYGRVDVELDVQPPVASEQLDVAAERGVEGRGPARRGEREHSNFASCCAASAACLSRGSASSRSAPPRACSRGPRSRTGTGPGRRGCPVRRGRAPLRRRVRIRRARRPARRRRAGARRRAVGGSRCRAGTGSPSARSAGRRRPPASARAQATGRVRAMPAKAEAEPHAAARLSSASAAYARAGPAARRPSRSTSETEPADAWPTARATIAATPPPARTTARRRLARREARNAARTMSAAAARRQTARPTPRPARAPRREQRLEVEHEGACRDDGEAGREEEVERAPLDLEAHEAEHGDDRRDDRDRRVGREARRRLGLDVQPAQDEDSGGADGKDPGQHELADQPRLVGRCARAAHIPSCRQRRGCR